jgi:large subunit ribosomal protein L15e
LYSEIGKSWQGVFHEKKGDILQRAIKFRKEPTIVRLEHPSRLDRARMLGFKAKEGVAVVRIRIKRGGMRRKRPTSGRRPKHLGVLRIKSSVSAQQVAERRVRERYPNMKVLGSYLVWADGLWSWFECVVIDPHNPAVRADYNYRRALGVVS